MIECKIAGLLSIVLMFLNGYIGLINGLMVIPLAYIDIKMQNYEFKQSIEVKE